MAYRVLYRTYRPSRFSEVIGQDYIIKTLQNAIATNRIAHAYLFCGPRGTGKTSVAKLFAKAVNCTHYDRECCDECASCKAALSGNHPDIIELDAASNNSVDTIRDIVEEVNYAPMLGRYKIYIIDEVHMLSASAFNALLKTLEEPPAHIIFILATTDPQKVIPTVLSRCQRYNFSKIRTYDIKRHLIDVLNKEGIDFDDKAVEEIARLSEGGMRDALSILEQCLSYNASGIYLEDVEHIFGLTTTAKKVELLQKIHHGDISDVIKEIRDMYQAGIDVKRLTSDLLEIIKETLIFADRGSDRLLERLHRTEAQQLLQTIPVKAMLEDAGYLEETLFKDRQNQNFILYLELCVLRMASVHIADKPLLQIVEEKAPEPVVEKAVEPVVEKTPEPIIEKAPEIEIADEKEVSEPLAEKEDTMVPAEETPDEVPLFTEEKEEPEPEEDPRHDLLLSILLQASKSDKISDSLIYNRLEMYKLESEKRKFYQMLSGTSIFASSKDAIIIHGSEAKASYINDENNNRELYRFINDEFSIDKMVFAVADKDLPELVDAYKKAKAEQRRIDVIIERYETEREETMEDRLKGLFGNVRVEE